MQCHRSGVSFGYLPSGITGSWRGRAATRFTSIARVGRRGFDKLKVGSRVRYVVDREEGEKGTQTSTVVLLD